MSSPLISIITVTYNAQASIARTLLSIRQQDFGEYELLIIDGNSTDGTISKIKEFEMESVSIFSEPDSGIYDAMNKGTRIAKGEWLLFLNSGDAFHSNRVLSSVAQYAATDNSTDIIYGDVETDSRIVAQNIRSPRDLFLRIPVCHQTIFYRRSVFQKCGDFDTRYLICADYEHLVKASLMGLKLRKIPVVVAKYQYGGFSHRNLCRLQQERLDIARRYFPMKFRLLFFLMYPFLVAKSYTLAYTASHE